MWESRRGAARSLVAQNRHSVILDCVSDCVRPLPFVSANLSMGCWVLIAPPRAWQLWRAPSTHIFHNYYITHISCCRFWALQAPLRAGADDVGHC
jgi:hypothetical protein